MISAERIKEYCLARLKAYEDYPFGDVPVCFRLNGRIFAQLYPNPDNFRITLKCPADIGQLYRQLYPGTVTRGYHCPPVQQPYWNTIDIGNFPEDELLYLIDIAYDTVLSGFPKKVRQQIAEE